MRFVLACILRAAGAAPMDGTLISFLPTHPPSFPQIYLNRRLSGFEKKAHSHEGCHMLVEKHKKTIDK